MRQQLIIAISAIIANPVMAEIKLYGSLHGSFQKLSHVDDQSTNSLVLDDALFGVKGTRDLSDDLSLIYQLSWGLSKSNFDGLNDGVQNRNQAIGLASPSGAVLVGRFDTPFKTLGKKADLFWYSQIGQNRHITNAKNWDVRADKIIVFQTPKRNGFQASAAYATDISDTSRLTDNASAISLSMNYKKENFTLGTAYENHELKSSSASRSSFRFTPHYKNKNIDLKGLFQKEDNATQVTNEKDANVFGVGASYRKDRGLYKAQYYVRDEEGESQNTKLISLGYDYRISPQVDLYAQAARLDGSVGFNGFEKRVGQFPVSAEKAVTLGLRVKF